MRQLLQKVAASFALLAASWLTPPPANAEPTKLTWFMWSGSEAEVSAWRHVAAMVTEKYPDITVEFQTTSFPDYWTKLPALAASGKLPDILSLQTQRSPGFARLLEPLDQRIKADKLDVAAFDPSIMKGLSRDGVQIALPYDFGPIILYYNTDMFIKAGLPLPAPGWTEADFDNAAAALTKDGQYGLVVSVPDAFIPFALSRGAHYLDARGNLDLTNDGIKQAFAAYVSLVNQKKWAPLFPASGTQSSSVANGRFTSGSIGMYADGPWQLLNVKRKANFKLGIAPLPARAAGSVTVTPGSGFGISATSKHRDEAWKAIQVMTGPEAEQYLAENGRAFPARIAMQHFWLETAAANIDGAAASLQAALKTAQPYITTPNWATVASLMEQYAPLAFAGGEEPAKVLTTIQQLATQ